MVELKKRYFIALGITIVLLCLTHHCWLGHKSSTHFDCLLFIIILVLGYLFSLKLTSYIADFKSIKKQSRIEIIFLSIFFILLFLPISHIDQSDISYTENRTLAKYHPLITKKGNLNLKYGKKYEEWFNDRFFLRKQLININYTIELLINKKIKTENIIYSASNNFIINTSQMPDKRVINKNIYSKILLNINRFNKFCLNNNIKLYILIIPPNAFLYQEKQLKETQRPVDLKFINSNIKKLQDKADARIIYPYNSLKKASQNEWVAFKVDNHWTDYGAFIGYQELMKAIHKDFKNITPVKESDYITFRSKKIRSDFNRKFFHGNGLSIAPFLRKYENKILDTEYLYFENKNKNLLKIKTIDIEGAKNKTFYYRKGANYRVLEIGTSMNENLLQFTPYTFKNLKYIRLNFIKNRNFQENFKIMKYYKKDILDYKPDIIILCITPLNLKELQNIFVEDK